MPAKQKKPRYKCHKEVEALQIETIESTQDGYKLHFAEDHNPIDVDGAMMVRYMAKPGDYYVVYAGVEPYASISPAVAFEEGYTKLADVKEPINKKLVKGDAITVAIKALKDGKLEVACSSLQHSPAVILVDEVMEASFVDGSVLISQRSARTPS